MTRQLFLVSVCLGLFFCLLVAGSAKAEFNYELGLDITTAFDDNMAFYYGNNVEDDAIYLIGLNPQAKLQWVKGKSDYIIEMSYLAEFYLDNDDPFLEDADSFQMDSWWTYRFTDVLAFVFSDTLDLAGFGIDYIDHPVSRQEYLDYSSYSGLQWLATDDMTLQLDLIWGMMEFQDYQRKDLASLHGKNWDDLGFRFIGEYEANPEMTFLVGYSWMQRSFEDSKMTPELDLAQGHAGFKAKLPTGTEVVLKGSLFHLEFQGTPPRQTEADYNKYGASLYVTHTLGEQGSISFNTYSKYALSYKQVRLFYRDSGMQLKTNWNVSELTALNFWLQIDELDYYGSFPEDSLTVTHAGLQLVHKINDIVSIAGSYRYYNRDTKWNVDLNSNRAAVTVKLLLPEF